MHPPSRGPLRDRWHRQALKRYAERARKHPGFPISYAVYLREASVLERLGWIWCEDVGPGPLPDKRVFLTRLGLRQADSISDSSP